MRVGGEGGESVVLWSGLMREGGEGGVSVVRCRLMKVCVEGVEPEVLGSVSWYHVSKIKPHFFRNSKLQ